MHRETVCFITGDEVTDIFMLISAAKETQQGFKFLLAITEIIEKLLLMRST